mmetsp:Transcript_8100/g.9423  ORF Transcript_8100/g.9423 Transcript_8100/m.9423 type:complete len:80 (+) Transcript_8100:942-1181(+)
MPINTHREKCDRNIYPCYVFDGCKCVLFHDEGKGRECAVGSFITRSNQFNSVQFNAVCMLCKIHFQFNPDNFRTFFNMV